jgi:hypothetical protein
LAVTQVGCSDGGGHIPQMSWLTIKGKVLLERYFGLQVLFSLMNKTIAEPIQQ